MPRGSPSSLFHSAAAYSDPLLAVRCALLPTPAQFPPSSFVRPPPSPRSTSFLLAEYEHFPSLSLRPAYPLSHSAGYSSASLSSLFLLAAAQSSIRSLRISLHPRQPPFCRHPSRLNVRFSTEESFPNIIRTASCDPIPAGSTLNFGPSSSRMRREYSFHRIRILSVYLLDWDERGTVLSKYVYRQSVIEVRRAASDFAGSEQFQRMLIIDRGSVIFVSLHCQFERVLSRTGLQDKHLIWEIICLTHVRCGIDD